MEADLLGYDELAWCQYEAIFGYLEGLAKAKYDAVLQLTKDDSRGPWPRGIGWESLSFTKAILEKQANLRFLQEKTIIFNSTTNAVRTIYLPLRGSSGGLGATTARPTCHPAAASSGLFAQVAHTVAASASSILFGPKQEERKILYRSEQTESMLRAWKQMSQYGETDLTNKQKFAFLSERGSKLARGGMTMFGNHILNGTNAIVDYAAGKPRNVELEEKATDFVCAFASLDKSIMPKCANLRSHMAATGDPALSSFGFNLEQTQKKLSHTKDPLETYALVGGAHQVSRTVGYTPQPHSDSSGFTESVLFYMPEAPLDPTKLKGFDGRKNPVPNKASGHNQDKEDGSPKAMRESEPFGPGHQWLFVAGAILQLKNKPGDLTQVGNGRLQGCVVGASCVGPLGKCGILE